MRSNSKNCKHVSSSIATESLLGSDVTFANTRNIQNKDISNSRFLKRLNETDYSRTTSFISCSRLSSSNSNFKKINIKKIITVLFLILVFAITTVLSLIDIYELKNGSKKLNSNVLFNVKSSYAQLIAENNYSNAYQADDISNDNNNIINNIDKNNSTINETYNYEHFQINFTQTSNFTTNLNQDKNHTFGLYTAFNSTSSILAIAFVTNITNSISNSSILITKSKRSNITEIALNKITEMVKLTSKSNDNNNITNISNNTTSNYDSINNNNNTINSNNSFNNNNKVQFNWAHCGQTTVSNNQILFDHNNDTIKFSKRLVKRIIGGHDALKNSWPFLVSVRIKINNKSIHNCGGTLITEHYVITAGHCFITYFKLLESLRLPLKNIFSLVEVQVGLHKHDQTNLTNEQIYQIEYFDIHDNFDFNEYTLYNDIAIIKLRRKVNLNRKEVNIVCLPALYSAYELKQDDKVVVVGWGAYAEEYDYGSFIKDNLQQALFKIKDQNDSLCNSGVIGKKWDRSMSVCAGSANIDNDRVTCFGDSGGPVMIYRNSRWIIVGIVSFAHDVKDYNTNKKKCNASMPFYFVKINAYLDWIYKKTNRIISR